MEIKEIFGPFLLKVPSYAYSHIYDVVVYEIGILAAVLVCFFKDPIKKANRKAVFRRTEVDIKAKRDVAEESSFLVRAAIMNYRRRNMVLVVIAALLSEVLFQIFAHYSPRIEPLTGWTFIALLVPVSVYYFVEVMSNWIGRIVGVLLIIAVFYANRLYCMINENHHKTCYAIKALVIIYGVIGIIVQFFFVKKYNKPVKDEKSLEDE
jgi:uncharacterized membrane protein